MNLQHDIYSNNYPDITDKLIECLTRDFPDKLPRKYQDSYELGVLVGQQQIIDKLKTEKSYNGYNLEFEKKLTEGLNNIPEELKEIEISLEYLLKVVSNIFYLYQSSGIDKKRKILQLVFSNFYIDGSKFLYELKRPFNEFVKESSCLKNLLEKSYNRTFCEELYISIINTSTNFFDKLNVAF